MYRDMDKGDVSDSPTLGKNYKKDKEGKRDKESWEGECKREKKREGNKERKGEKKPERNSEERGRTKYT